MTRVGRDKAEGQAILAKMREEGHVGVTVVHDTSHGGLVYERVKLEPFDPDSEEGHWRNHYGDDVVALPRWSNSLRLCAILRRKGGTERLSSDVGTWYPRKDTEVVARVTERH